jgi:hypothetical protein
MLNLIIVVFIIARLSAALCICIRDGFSTIVTPIFFVYFIVLLDMSISP